MSLRKNKKDNGLALTLSSWLSTHQRGQSGYVKGDSRKNGYDEAKSSACIGMDVQIYIKFIGDFNVAYRVHKERPYECPCPECISLGKGHIEFIYFYFITKYSTIQIENMLLSIEHLLSVTLKRFSSREKVSHRENLSRYERFSHLGKWLRSERSWRIDNIKRHIDDIMEALYKNDVKSTDEDVAKLLKYVGNPKYLAFLRPGLRGLCVKNIHDLKNWFYYYKKSALLPSEIKALFVIDKFQNLRLCLSSRHVFCANGEAVFAAGEITFQFSESPKTGKTKRQEMDVCITHITNKSWDYRPSLDSWTFVDAALRELEIDFPDGFMKEYVYTEGV